MGLLLLLIRLDDVQDHVIVLIHCALIRCRLGRRFSVVCRGKDLPLEQLQIKRLRVQCVPNAR